MNEWLLISFIHLYCIHEYNINWVSFLYCVWTWSIFALFQNLPDIKIRLILSLLIKFFWSLICYFYLQSKLYIPVTESFNIWGSIIHFLQRILQLVPLQKVVIKLGPKYMEQPHKFNLTSNQSKVRRLQWGKFTVATSYVYYFV